MSFKSKFAVLGLLGLFAAAPAWSIPIGDVGSIDQLIAQTNLGNSGDETERQWVASVLGLDLSDLTYETRTDVTGSDWELVTGTDPGVWAFELTGPADWFLIKTGDISGQPNRHFLFNNLASFAYAVVRLADLGITKIDNVSKISHVGEFNGPTEVPEPGTLALLGTGLLALGLWRRRKNA